MHFLWKTSNFCETETVNILYGTADYKLVVNLKTPERSGVKRPNANNINFTEARTCFNKFRPLENGKTGSKITESM